MPATSLRPSISASSSPPGTGTSSTWCGCSCSSASTSGSAAPDPWPDTDAGLTWYKGGGRQDRPFFVSPLSQGGEGQNMSPEQSPTLTQSALRGIACRCPRCGRGKLY